MNIDEHPMPQSPGRSKAMAKQMVSLSEAVMPLDFALSPRDAGERLSGLCCILIMTPKDCEW